MMRSGIRLCRRTFRGRVGFMAAIGMLVSASTMADVTAHEPVKPLPAEMHLDARKVRLGKMLFGDPRLSGNNSFACSTCHQLDKGGTDNLALSPAVNGGLRSRNTPTVFNVAFNYSLLWDGKVQSLEQQVVEAIPSPVTMGASWKLVLERLNADDTYRHAFEEIYGIPVRQDAVADAIATYERSLVTPNSRFDRYLQSDESTLSEEELAGYELFKDYGCAGCHQGINIGGNTFQKAGIFADPEHPYKEHGEPDPGRYRLTGRERDRKVFRVPSLRNIALTAPYLHDGRVATLNETVRFMARVQLGRELSDLETQYIVGFLNALTGEYAGVPLSQYTDQ